jgi:hypothetical protein
MELDDLRRQWRQPKPASVPVTLSKAELSQLLARQSGSIVTQLRRNARLEMVVNYALLFVSVLMAWLASVLWVRLWGGLLAAIAVICVFYFHRKLGLLRSLNDPTGNLHAHLVRLTTGLRTLIRFYYRLTLAVLPVTCLLMGFMVLSTSSSVVTPRKIWVIAGGLTFLCLAIYLPIAHTTRRYLHWLYGQHLDRLEGQLRELNDGPEG